MKNISDLEELILTTDSNGDVKPEFMEENVSEAALRMGLVEKREFRTVVPDMISTWFRLTETGNLIKARLSTKDPQPSSYNRYTLNNPDYGVLMTIEEFREAVIQGYFIDYDGHGSASNGTHIDPNSRIYPSTMEAIPTDATHIMWYNR